MDADDYGRALRMREECAAGVLLPLFGTGGARYAEIARVISAECGDSVTPQAVGLWVRGKAVPTLSHALALYHVTEAHLAGRQAAAVGGAG